MLKWGLGFILLAILLSALGVGGGLIAWEVGKWLIIGAIVIIVVGIIFGKSNLFGGDPTLP